MTSWVNKTFFTHNSYGSPNGCIIRVWEEDIELQDYRPKHVYVTTVLPGSRKGPHMHMKRDSLFCCIHGQILILIDGKPILSSGREPVAVHVPAGTACGLQNTGSVSALVLNLSSGHYDPTDELEVKDFQWA